MLNFQGTVYIRTGLLTHCPFVGGSIFLVNPGSVLSINQHPGSVQEERKRQRLLGKAGLCREGRLDIP